MDPRNCGFCDECAKGNYDQCTQRKSVYPEIPRGWVFYSADFSLQANGHSKCGRVTLIRDSEGRKWWHSLSEECQNIIDLHLCGTGETLYEAIKHASLCAEYQYYPGGFNK